MSIQLQPIKLLFNEIFFNYTEGNYFLLALNSYSCVKKLSEYLNTTNNSISTTIVIIFLLTLIFDNKNKVNVIRYNGLLGIERTCPICMEFYKLGDDVVKTECNHYFCKKCISEWCSSNNSCPMCRTKIKTNTIINC